MAGLAIAISLGLASLGSPPVASGLTPPPPQKAALVFESGGRIVEMKADGSGRRVLTRKNASFYALSDDADSGPRISPDGDSIVFSRYRTDGLSGGVTQIVVKDREDGGERVLLSGTDDSGPGSAVFSADSKRIFYVRFDFRSRRFAVEVRSVGIDGTGNRRLIRSVMRFGKKRIVGDALLPFEIAPSPDGRNLLVSYSRVYGAKPSRLYLMNANSGKRRLIQKDAGSGSWSSDGRRIAFVSERDRLNKSCYEGSCGFDPQIYVMKANGRGAKRLLRGPARGSQYSPDWSADRGRIAFTSGRFNEIFSARPDGRCLTRLTNGSPGSGSPEWAPANGFSAAAGTCGDAAPKPLAEITPDQKTLDLELAPFWLGSAYRDRLLGDIFKDGRVVTTSYDDCSLLRAKRCSPPVSVNSGPVCEKFAGSVFDDGTFRKLVRRRGALVILARPSGRGLETIAYSGGVETAIYTPRKYRGRKVTSADHLKIVDRMRPVTRKGRQGSFEAAVFTLSEVQAARSVLRAVKRRGSLAAAARKLDLFPRLAAGYLRFGKALERQGKVLTAKCRGRSVVPGSTRLR